MVHLETLDPKLGCEVSHGRQHQMKSLAMPAFAGDLGFARHHQNPAVARLSIGEGTDVSVQLVTEDPHRVELRHCFTGSDEGSGWRNNPSGMGESQRTRARFQDGDAPGSTPSCSRMSAGTVVRAALNSSR